MNKRFILIDDDPKLKGAANLTKWYMQAAVPYVYTCRQLINTMPENEVNELLTLGPGDGVIVVGPEAFRMISERYHVGIRGENYFDCSVLRRVGLDCGAFIKVYHEEDLPVLHELAYFMSPKFTQVRTFPDYTWRIIKTYEDAIQELEYFESLPKSIKKGFDYETSGMPLEVTLFISGAALCARRRSIFFSFTEILRNSGPEAYQKFMERFGKLLRDQDESLWVYNLQFEQQVTWRFFGIETSLNDTSVFNVMDGLHAKNYSLKWSIQRLLGGGDTVTPSLGDIEKWDSGGIIPWDTDFDRLEELLNSMYFEYQQEPGTKGKKNMVRVIKVTPETYKNTPEWQEICARYPDYIPEFERLILEYWGMPFMNIPADILGYYCCLDAFYTVEAAEEHESRYSLMCQEVFQNNLRLGSLLHRSGMFKDESYRLAYNEECKHNEAYGIIYCATARCKWKMDKHSKLMANPKKYNPIWLKLMNKQMFHNGDPLEITKTLLSTYQTPLTDTGFDDGQMFLDLGEEAFVDFLKSTLEKRMAEIKFKGKIDPGVVRKKKLLGLVAEDIKAYLKIPDTPLGNKHIELEKYLWYERAYNGFLKIWSKGLTVDNVPDKFWFLGKVYEREEFTEMVLETFFKCSSPLDSAKITRELIEMFPSETTFLTTIYGGINKLPGGKRFYENLGITDVQAGYEHFMREWEIWWNAAESSKNGFVNFPQGYVPVYPIEIWQEAKRLWDTIGDPKKEVAEELTTTWDSFDGYLKQSTYFKFVDDWKLMGQPYSESDWNLPRFDLIRKLVVNIMFYKKYRKMRTAYTDESAMFKATDKHVIVDPVTLMPIRCANPDEPGADKMFPHYEICKKETKRWSSGYHTIISHSDVKDVIAAPPGYLLTYFDISSAEVRTAAYRSKDPVMIHLFETKQDLYIHVAKLYFKDQWDLMGKDEKKKWRKAFKTILLGVMYGMGAKTMSTRIGIEVSLAQELIDTMMSEFKVLKQYIVENMAYPERHQGFLNQIYGDTLRSRSWRFANKPDGSIDKFEMLKVQRHGINWIIQSSSALTLAAGFYNNVKECRKELGINLVPIIVVHDSNTNYFPVDRLFELRAAYDKYFTGYCSDRVNSPFLFDLFIGRAYQSAAEVKQIDQDTIEMEASAYVINGILDKIDNESNLIVETSIPRDQIVPKFIENRFDRFIQEEGCSLVMDKSKYQVQIRKIGTKQ